MDGPAHNSCKVCGLVLQVRGCTTDKCRDTPAGYSSPRPFGKPNILTTSEKEKRQEETTEERRNKALHEYVVGNLVRRRQWIDHHDREIERAEEESRRYSILLMEIRQACPMWTAEAVREKALVLVRLERGDRELRLSYLPKAKFSK